MAVSIILKKLCCQRIRMCRCEAVYFRRSSLPTRLGDCFVAKVRLFAMTQI